MKSFGKQKRFIEVNNIAGIITEKLSHKFRQSTMEFYPMTKEKNKMHSSGCEHGQWTYDVSFFSKVHVPNNWPIWADGPNKLWGISS